MKIEVLLRREALEYSALQQQLNAEINAMVELASAEAFSAGLRTNCSHLVICTERTGRLYGTVSRRPSDVAGGR